MANGMKGMFSLVAMLALAGCATTRPPSLESALARQQQAEQAYEAGDLARASAEYEALTRALPLNADYWFRLGNVYVRMNQPDAAADAYGHALKREPKHAKAWHNLAIVRLRQAAAAFTQSADSAEGVDSALREQSAAMAHGIARLDVPPSTEVDVSGDAAASATAATPVQESAP